MIAYRVLRACGRLALRWFYRDVEVAGMERLPSTGPALLASNHPNALVDALVIGCTLHRPVTLTAKATLLDNPITRSLLRAAGVVPLRRATDDTRRGTGGLLDPSRNANAFAAVLDILADNGIVLLFPEGKSHSEPELAPLKTGLARITLMARDDRHLDVPIIPVGLTFERKWEPRSRVLMHVGTPIRTGRSAPNVDVATLTRRVDAGLRAVTLNFASADDAQRVLAMSATLTEILDEFRPLHAPDPPLADRVRVAQRINTITPHLTELPPDVAMRIERFLERLTEFERATQSNGIATSDVGMTTSIGRGVWFAIRESFIGAIAGPLALWGRVNHWLPVRTARWLALRTSKLPDEPAMNTIIAGLVSVLVFYSVQIAIVAWAFGWIAAVVYTISLPASATWDFRYADRLRRAFARIRTYRRFRKEPDLHAWLLAELAWLRTEVTELQVIVDDGSNRNIPSADSLGPGRT